MGHNTRCEQVPMAPQVWSGSRHCFRASRKARGAIRPVDNSEKSGRGAVFHRRRQSLWKASSTWTGSVMVRSGSAAGLIDAGKPAFVAAINHVWFRLPLDDRFVDDHLRDITHG